MFFPMVCFDEHYSVQIQPLLLHQNKRNTSTSSNQDLTHHTRLENSHEDSNSLLAGRIQWVENASLIAQWSEFQLKLEMLSVHWITWL